MMKDISTTSGQVPFLPFHFSDFYQLTYLPKSTALCSWVFDSLYNTFTGLHAAVDDDFDFRSMKCI